MCLKTMIGGHACRTGAELRKGAQRRSTACLATLSPPLQPSIKLSYTCNRVMEVRGMFEPTLTTSNKAASQLLMPTSSPHPVSASVWHARHPRPQVIVVFRHVCTRNVPIFTKVDHFLSLRHYSIHSIDSPCTLSTYTVSYWTNWSERAMHQYLQRRFSHRDRLTE